MTKTDERNQKVKQILEQLYKKAIDPTNTINESRYKSDIEKIFDTEAWGFREIILVVIVGMKLDKNYKASSSLYSCNPRAIYEGPIKEFLISKNIPHRKSGPLNIAKAAPGLNNAWASQRRPRDVANKVVNIVNLLESSNFVEDVGVSILRRLVAESERVENLKVTIEPSSNPEILHKYVDELIRKTPDSGNTPQKIAAFLLKNYHLSMNTGVIVTGEQDRASVTSTTSKKPGDVNEESSNGEIYKVYEITVKPFDIARIRDSYDCVKIYNESNNNKVNEIIVICRPEDCPNNMVSSNLHCYMGSYEYQNIIYYYWNIYEWTADTLQRMTSSARISFYEDLNNYISDINTSESVKNLWRKLHE